MNNSLVSAENFAGAAKDSFADDYIIRQTYKPHRAVNMSKTPVAKVERNQFEVHANTVLHRPTGATFGARPGDARLIDVDPGLTGKPTANGVVYNLTDVERVAMQLLAERLQTFE
jgi:hypothetical protein